MAQFLSTQEKASLLQEAKGLFSQAKLTEQERIVVEMLSGASAGYRYSISEVCALLRQDESTVEGLHLTATEKLGTTSKTRLGEIGNLLTADFPERE